MAGQNEAKTQANTHDRGAKAPGAACGRSWFLVVCLRLALIIQRGYSEYDVNVKSFTQRHDEFTLELQSGWREENTLLETDIEQEIDYLRRVNIKLKVN